MAFPPIKSLRWTMATLEFSAVLVLFAVLVKMDMCLWTFLANYQMFTDLCVELPILTESPATPVAVIDDVMSVMAAIMPVTIMPVGAIVSVGSIAITRATLEPPPPPPPPPPLAFPVPVMCLSLMCVLIMIWWHILVIRRLHALIQAQRFVIQDLDATVQGQNANAQRLRDMIDGQDALIQGQEGQIRRQDETIQHLGAMINSLPWPEPQH